MFFSPEGGCLCYFTLTTKKITIITAGCDWWQIFKTIGFCPWLPVTQPVRSPCDCLELSAVIKVRILAMFCFYSFFSSTPSLSSAWLPLYMLSMSDPAVTTNYLEGLQASLLTLTTALFLLKAQRLLEKKAGIWEIFSASAGNSSPRTDVSICWDLIFSLMHSSMKGSQIGVR